MWSMLRGATMSSMVHERQSTGQNWFNSAEELWGETSGLESDKRGKNKLEGGVIYV
jgi:hypothetical protein